MATLIINNELAINRKYKKIFIILQSIETFIVLLLNFLALLQLKNILKLSEISLFLSLAVWFMCLALIYSVTFIKFRKDIGWHSDMPKETYKTFDNTYAIHFVSFVIKIFLIGILGFTSIVRSENISFSKNCIETTATITGIDRKINEIEYNDETQYKTEFKYRIYYNIDGEGYNSSFEKTTAGFDNERSAKTVLPKYDKGDKLTIYVNTNDYNDYKLSIKYISDILFYTLMSISITLTLLLLIYSIKVVKRYYNTDYLSKDRKIATVELKDNE